VLTAAELAQIGSGLAPGAVAAAYFSTSDGHLDPVRVTHRFLDRARQLGARIVFRPVAAATKIVYDGPRGLEFKQMADGRIVGTDASAPPNTPAHREIRDHAVDFPDDTLRTLHGRRILERIATYLPAARAAAFDYLTLGFRPMPVDGFPVVGALPGVSDVYVAVTHSGVTLAPILGQYASREILGEDLIDWLAPYRPARFAAGARAAAAPSGRKSALA
jgi:glycine/D-amino acid oxidase-like deaminating enzyme